MTDRTPDILDTIARIYGGDAARELIPVSSSLPFMTISGDLSRPSRSRKDNARMLVAINQRYISSSFINNAIREGYGTLLPKDRLPVTFLRLEIDTELVDVNVHPTKKLVRLTREKEIGDAIQEAVRTALLTHDLIPAAEAPPLPGESLTVEPSNLPGPVYQYNDSVPSGVSETSHTGTSVTDRQLRQTEVVAGFSPFTPLLPPMEVIGEFGGIYILVRTVHDELIVIDQHAAHERILYQQVTVRIEGERRSQELDRTGSSSTQRTKRLRSYVTCSRNLRRKDLASRTSAGTHFLSVLSLSCSGGLRRPGLSTISSVTLLPMTRPGPSATANGSPASLPAAARSRRALSARRSSASAWSTSSGSRKTRSPAHTAARP